MSSVRVACRQAYRHCTWQIDCDRSQFPPSIFRESLIITTTAPKLELPSNFLC
ncbi:MAG: hypothetical protein WBV73_03390 [Phormidium sp.]